MSEGPHHSVELPSSAADAGTELTEFGVGSRIGDYEALEEIARGSFGTVWRAQQTTSGRLVALKVLRPELAWSAEFAARFAREARALGAIRHANVVELLELGRLSDGRPFFAMEFVPGVDLATYIECHGAMTPIQALPVVEAICDAVTAAHSLGIIHRDIKPSNVMLGERDGKPRIVLLDFGLAKVLDGEGRGLTESRAVLGTPSSMAPEQIRGELVDERADIYAIGALAFHLLTGSPPFASATTLSVEYLHLYSRRPRPSTRVDISSEFDDVITGAMSRDRRKRQQSVAEFMAAFRHALNECHIEATSSSELSPTPRLLMLYLDVFADEEALEDPDDALIDAMESIVPQAEIRLRKDGFARHHEVGSSALYVKTVPPAGLSRSTYRGEAIRLMRELSGLLTNETSQEPRVRVGIYLHIVEARAIDESAIEWVTQCEAARLEGCYASPEIIDGIDAIDAIEESLSDLVCRAPPLYGISS